MQRRGGRGQPSCGPEELPPQRRKPPPGLRLPRPNSGSWGVGELPSFPSMSSSLFFLSADGSPESPSTARRCGPQRTELPAGPFPLFRGLIFSSIPNTQQPRGSAPQVGEGLRGSLLLGKEARACHGEVTRRPAEGRGLWFLQLGLGMQQERVPSAPLGKDPTCQNAHGLQKASPPRFPETRAARASVGRGYLECQASSRVGSDFGGRKVSFSLPSALLLTFSFSLFGSHSLYLNF